MFCEICHQKIVVKRDLWHLFEHEIHHICEKCYIKFPLYTTYHLYPIQGYLMFHVTLSSITYPHDDLGYQSFIASHIQAILNQQKDIIFLYAEWMDEDLYELLDSLVISHFYVLTLYENIG